jgi:uncharacterized protein with PQ loop repeat
VKNGSESGADAESVNLMFGLILGWLSTIIYIASRIPQMKLMMLSKDVTGLNGFFFLLTFSGNLTQCLSMLVSREIYSNLADLISKLPWLLSASVCMFQDLFILVLIYYYSHVLPKNTVTTDLKY